MTEHDRNTQNTERRKRTGSLVPVFIIIAALFFLIAGAAIFFFPKTQQDQTVPPATKSLAATPDTASPDTTSLTDNKPGEEPPAAGVVKREQQEGIIPGMSIPTEAKEVEAKCRVVAAKLHTFFQHIDKQDYIKRYNLPETTQTYFTTLAYKLLDNPPVVSRESDDLYTILRNMAHFFRIIGKDNIILLKTILDRERDKIEDIAAELYFCASPGICTDDQFTFSPGLAKMYEYAGFFLNTMGGRSYLFRRDSRSRLLVNYYSILLVDQANEKGLNRHGIDITLVIPQLVQEIESSNQLIYKENYLDQLYSLLEKYQ